MAATRRTRVMAATLAGVLLAAGAAVAQFGFARGPFHEYPNIPYDGRFTFVRLKYTTAPGGYWYGGWPAWGHGYPLAEQNLMRIMNEVSFLNPHTEEINALTLDDPELFRYPIAYIIEVDWWAMTDGEAASLRAYMQKGGFVIVDDFKPRRCRGGFGGGSGGYGYGSGWDVFEAAMARVLAARDALQRGDAAAFGASMNASHQSLRDDFEVSTADVDALVEIAQAQDEVFGARLTGGGFGGSVVLLVRRGRARDVADRVARRYRTERNRTPTILIPVSNPM